MKIATSAPGKTFLLGEYSVLVGGSALLVAINRRANVNIYPSQSSGVLISADQTYRTSVEATSILASAIESLERRRLFDRRVLEDHEIELDTSIFYKDGTKLGLGSSAALMVAILRALCPATVSFNHFLDLAMACHTEFQGGLGSGADIATSIMGGCIRFNMDQRPTPAGLPPALQLFFVWTGEAAVTTRFIERFNQWRLQAPKLAAPHLEKLGTSSQEAVTDVESRRSDEFIDKVRQINRQLIELSEAANLQFYTPAHHKLRKIVEDAQCAYKPSGAGGGDFGVVFSTDAERIMALHQSLLEEGYLVLSADEIAPSSECLSRSNNE